MTHRAKYLYAYIAGSVFWAVVFYLAAYRAGHWTFWRVIIAYLIFEAWIGVTGLALYKTALIPAYGLRLRRMFLILGCSIGAPVAGINGWALYDSTAPLRTVALGIIIALAVVAGCMWLAYKSALKLRLGSRPDDVGRGLARK